MGFRAWSAHGGHLDRPTSTDVGDDHLLAVVADPHRLADKAMGRRVQAPIDRHHRLGTAHDPGLTEGGGEGLLRQAVQAVSLLDEHLRRRPAGDPVGPGVDLFAERDAGCLQRRPVAIGDEEVGVGGHQVGLGHPHCRLRAALDGASAGRHVTTVSP